MMQLKLTAPLSIQTATGKTLELLPVHMADGYPSKKPELWSAFLKPGAQRLACDKAEINKVQDYMCLHRTEALSEDCETAYTVLGDGLVECLPEVCNSANSGGSE